MTPLDDTIPRRIRAATHPQELFGADADRAANRDAYRGLARAVHPDAGAPSADADAFMRLAALYARAERDLARGAYALAEIAGRRHRYRISAELARGDASILYAARFDGDDGRARDGIVKVVRDAADNDLAAAEAATLAGLLGNVATYDVLAPYLPAYVETFGLTTAAAPERRRALAFAAPHDELLSLREIRARRPAGLPAQDGAWMLRRILVALALVHANGVVHGALTPDHVLVAPALRGIVLVDWKYAVQIGATVAALPRRWRAMAAPEIAATRPAGPATDIFMAMRCVAHVLGGDAATGAMPERAGRRMAGFLRGASHADPRRRPADALALKDELDELSERLWGPRTFAPLEI